jgi:DNA invertase Pin-like site-specific DNA recombinase
MATKSKKTAVSKRTTAAKKAKAIKGRATKGRAAEAKNGKPAQAGAPKAGTKKALLLAMLTKGATNTKLCKALGWLPHTLRAAISRTENVKHSRVDGVTSYRIEA